jgi:hypothetical protein
VHRACNHSIPGNLDSGSNKSWYLLYSDSAMADCIFPVSSNKTYGALQHLSLLEADSSLVSGILRKN